MKQKKVTFKNSKGRKLGGTLHIPDGKGPFPAVVLVHGFGGSQEELKNIHMCKALAKAGFVALRFDFYDKPNNISEPKIEDMTLTQQLDGTRAAIDFIEKQPFVDKNRIGLTGHSLGGMTALIYAPTDKRVKALVSQSPVSRWGESRSLKRFAKVLKQFEAGKRKGERSLVFDKRWGKMKVKLGFYQDGAEYDTCKISERITFPTLVFHGDRDETVPWEQSRDLIKHIKGGKLDIIKGADHCYRTNNTLPMATKLLVDWMVKYL